MKGAQDLMSKKVEIVQCWFLPIVSREALARPGVEKEGQQWRGQCRRRHRSQWRGQWSRRRKEHRSRWRGEGGQVWAKSRGARDLLSRSTKEEESSPLHLPAFVLALQSSFTYLQFGPCRLIQLRNGTDRNAISRHFQRSF